MHDCGDFGSVCVGAESQRVLTFVDLPRIIAVDRVGGRPVGILLRKSSNRRIVVSGAEVVGLCFLVEVLAAVAEGVVIVAGGCTRLVAEGIVVVILYDRAGGFEDADHIAVGIEQKITRRVAELSANEAKTPDIMPRLRAVGVLRHHIAAVQQEVGVLTRRALGSADAGGVVGVSVGRAALLQNGELVEAVVLIQLRAVGAAHSQEIAVGVVGVDRGCGRAADFLVLLRSVLLKVPLAYAECIVKFQSKSPREPQQITTHLQ